MKDYKCDKSITRCPHTERPHAKKVCVNHATRRILTLRRRLRSASILTERTSEEAGARAATARYGKERGKLKLKPLKLK
jgi:hypothetical protein